MTKSVYGIDNVTQKFLEMIKLPDSKCKLLNYLMVMPVQANTQSQYTFPIGFSIVSSSLKASGRNVYTLNLTYKNNPIELLKKTIVNNKIDVVATGGLSAQYSKLREIIDTVKTINPEIVTIVGGGIITAEPQVAMEALKNADYGVIGEGEITINALAYALETEADASKVEGVISVSHGGEYIVAPPRAEIMDLDSLPFPDYDGFDYGDVFERKYSPHPDVKDYGVTIITARSCPYNCTFCFHSSGKKYRRRSLDNIFAELELLMSKYPFRHVGFADELFGVDLVYAQEFCRIIKSYGLNYQIKTRLDRLSSELLDMLQDSGCKEIGCGIEHISDKILKSMKKNTKAELIEPTLDMMISRGIRPMGNIIFGDMAETPETIMEALSWWKDHRRFPINLIYLMTFPGSYVYKVACSRGIIKDPVQFLCDGCPTVNLTTMSDEVWDNMKDEISMTRILYESAEKSVDAEQLTKILDSIASNDFKTCVWPASHIYIRFFKNISEAFCKSTFYVNINRNVHTLRTSDGGVECEIYEPDVLKDENIEIVICPNIKIIDEIREMCMNNYSSVKRVLSIAEIKPWWDEYNKGSS